MSYMSEFERTLWVTLECKRLQSLKIALHLIFDVALRRGDRPDLEPVENVLPRSTIYR